MQMGPFEAAPSLGALANHNPGETSFMRHFDGPREPGKSAGAPSAWVALPDISPLLVAAVVQAEDPRFFAHRGIDWRAIAHKTAASLRERRIVGGASTITQQLARNLYLTPCLTVTRKLREMRMARRMDAALPKARVLELYLNLIEWGPGIWGCSAAARHYFAKAPADLDLFEATFLVSLIPAPKAAFTAANAMRSRRKQFSSASLLLLAGMVDGEQTAACLQRIRRFQRLVADGHGLRDALRDTGPSRYRNEAALLDRIAAALDVQPFAHDELLRSGGEVLSPPALARLLKRIDRHALREVIATGNVIALGRALRIPGASPSIH